MAGHHHHGTAAQDHGHGHGQHHGHGHAPATYGTAFAIGTGLNLAFVIGEAVAGLLVHSMALIGDAGHNLGDVLGLLLAWGASIMARRGPTGRYTYGYGRGTIMAALANAAILLVTVGAIAVEAIRRLISPEHTQPIAVAAVAAIGILVNGLSAALFAAGRKRDLNLRGAFTHMAADAVVSLGVVIAALCLWLTGWQRIDPAVSLVLALMIAWSTRPLLTESVTLSFDAVPHRIDPSQVRQYLSGLPGVLRIHDLHVWPISTTRAALTCHIVTGTPPDAGFIARACHDLNEKFGIDHSTLQVEREGDSCVLEQDHVV